MDVDLFIDDLFFNLVGEYYQVASRKNVSIMAGRFSKALAAVGISKTPRELRENFFSRV